MDRGKQASPILMWTALISFFSISLGSICISGFQIMLLVNCLLTLPSTVVISKGLYYLFGGGISMGALTVDGAIVTVLKRSPSDRAATLIGKLMVGGLVVMFLLPHLIHYPVADYLEKKGYHFCAPLSTHWRFVRTITYTKPGHCIESYDQDPRMNR